MSAIDDMKKSANPELVLDATDEDIEQDGIIIDNITGVNRVDLSSLNKQPQGRHQFIASKPPEAKKKKRVAVDIKSVAKKDPEDENAHVSPIDDILGVDNPNSMFSKYVKEKEKEAVEWIAEKEEEAEISEEYEEDGEDHSNDDYYVAPSTSVNLELDNIDISGIDNEEEENINMGNNEEIDVDKMIDTEDLPYDEDMSIDEIDNIEEYEDDEVVESDDEDLSYADEFDIILPTTNLDEEVVESDDEDPSETVAVEEDDELEVPEGFEVQEKEETFTTEIEDDDDNSTTEVAAPNETDVLKHLQKLATEKLKPVSTKLDISSFTVLKKPVTNIAPIFKETSARVVKWVLPSQGSVVLMKEFTGSELEKLREYSENTRSVDSMNRRFHMIYDHIMSPKPGTFEQWLKTTPYSDIDHYFFAIYIACFKGANFLTEDCKNDKCKETFLTDDVDIMDMVKFESKEAKNKFVELYQSESTIAGKGVYCTEVVPMNDKIAIGFREPSIYNILELISINEKTRSKYSNIIEYIPYIDTMYAIEIQ
jgi:hypothetical protein